MVPQQKLLSVVVPAYNAQEYLVKCLDSLLVADRELFSKLEVLVVNDGSTDSTSAIAHEYEGRYPDVFRVIDKDNGNSGSCINVALAVAKGRYFRELDSDDWLATEALAAFITLLEGRREDIVSTLKRNHFPNGKTQSYQGLGVEYDTTCLIDGFIFRNRWDKVHFTMHTMSFRTGLLRSIGYRQMEGIFYTDMILCYFALKAARDIWFSKLCLYQYSDGREDQSISRENSMLHRHDYFLVSERLLKDFIPIQDSFGENRRHILVEIICNYVNVFYRLCPVSDPDRDALDKLVSLQPELKQLSDDNRFGNRNAEIYELLRQKTKEIEGISAKLTKAQG